MTDLKYDTILNNLSKAYMAANDGKAPSPDRLASYKIVAFGLCTLDGLDTLNAAKALSMGASILFTNFAANLLLHARGKRASREEELSMVAQLMHAAIRLAEDSYAPGGQINVQMGREFDFRDMLKEKKP
jgi:hypothetical protein